MELRHLRYMLAVAEEMSFTRAAARLHLAQPALSIQIRQLEAELGVELFDRSRRAISLTTAGELMASESRELLRCLDRSVELVRKTGEGAVGHLAIGFVPSAANATLPPLLRDFTRTSPEVIVQLREMAPAQLIGALHEGRLDVCFIYLPFNDPSLGQAVVARERFVVALPAGHRLARHSRVDVEALSGERFVLPAEHGMPGLRAQVIAICRDAGFVPDAVQDDVWLLQTIIGLVASGSGIALVPANARALTPDGIVYRHLTELHPHVVELAAIWRRDRRSPTLTRFLGQMPTLAVVDR